MSRPGRGPATSGAPVRTVLSVGALAVLTGCGDDGGGLDVESFAGTYVVTMVVGAATSGPGAHPVLLPEPGTSFTERWELDCDPASCVLNRPDGGVALGDLDGLVLAPPPPGPTEAVEALTGTAEGVRAEAAIEPGPCTGAASERWTVQVDVSHEGDVLSGSVVRTPDELRDTAAGPDCYGVDLTLGLSGVRR
jgi:hypothetical protein